MNIEEMTPEQLRSYAEQKERAHGDLLNRYMGVAPQGAGGLTAIDGNAAKPWEKTVEFEGETYIVDMRRLKSRKFFELYGRIQKAIEKSGSADVADMMELYSYLFYNIDAQVERLVTEKFGYDDFEEIYRIETAIFEAVQAKN